MDAFYQAIPLNQIKPSPYQARKEFNEDALRELAESMRHEGLIEPIIVRRFEDNFELISGERRIRAARALGWDVIDAKIIETVSEAEVVAKGLIENIQRQNLNPVEEAEGFLTLNRLDNKYWTQAKIAEVSGKSQSYVSQSISLFELPAPILNNIRARIFSRSHGIELTRLATEAQQLEVAEQIPGKLTWQETRHLVDGLLHRKNGSKSKKSKNNQADEAKDPLGSFWPNFMSKPEHQFAGSWKAEYQLREGESADSQEVGWDFFVKIPKGEPLEGLKTWFRKMADALEASIPKPAAPAASLKSFAVPTELLKQLAQQLPAKRSAKN